jgi:hypothetical protein
MRLECDRDRYVGGCNGVSEGRILFLCSVGNSGEVQDASVTIGSPLGPAERSDLDRDVRQRQLTFMESVTVATRLYGNETWIKGNKNVNKIQPADVTSSCGLHSSPAGI